MLAHVTGTRRSQYSLYFKRVTGFLLSLVLLLLKLGMLTNTNRDQCRPNLEDLLDLLVLLVLLAVMETRR